MPDPLPASETSAARAKKSVDRTLAWADLQLRHMRTAEPAQDADGAEQQRPAKRARAAEAGDEGGEEGQGDARPLLREAGAQRQRDRDALQERLVRSHLLPSLHLHRL